MFTRNFFVLLCTYAFASSGHAELNVTSLGKQFIPDAGCTIKQVAADKGGSTSVRNEPAENLKFKTSGYFQRNRDLGQVFVAKRTGYVERLILRTGNSDAAVLSGTAGQELFVQWFEVVGTPVINDNATPKGTEAKHGYSTNHRCDDFIEGITYRSMKVVRGGTFPDLPATRDADGRSTGDATSKLTYMQFKFSGEQRVTLEAGRRYAFLVGLVNPSAESGFTLANSNRASRPDAVPDDITKESSVGGWGIRREGNGGIKPKLLSESEPTVDSEQRSAMLNESMLPDGGKRFELPPQTDGFPDVDTYRDHEFSIVQSGLNVKKVDGPPTGESVKIQQTIRDETGPTSFRYYAPRTGKPTKTNALAFDPDPTRSDEAIKSENETHYYYRDRDLGQTFTTGDTGFRLGAITVRLQPVDVKGGGDPGGAKVSLQLMKVTGKPTINDNSTTDGNPRWATYAFTWPDDPDDDNTPNRRPFKHFSDDFIEGETYEHLMLASGGIVPDDLNTNDYLRWEFIGESQYQLQPNTIYAFLLLFDEPAAPGVNRNIPLSNRNVLPGGKSSDPFPGGHMIRRDGSSTVFDDVFIRNVDDPKDVEASRSAAAFPTKMSERIEIQPGTLGYPDVDTYRDMYFILEAAR
ncbi:MAG: hypothetical protein WBD31_20260 [Rubripirellula sp.]